MKQISLTIAFTNCILDLPRKERAYIIAAIDIRVEREKKKQKEIERKQRRGRRK